MLRATVLAAFLTAGLSAAALAQTTTAPADTSTAPADTSTTTDTKQGVVLTSPSGLQKGSNSFTEAQAKGRLEDHGFTGVSGLTKDDNGVWWATAAKDSKSVRVGLDFQGNIAVE
jgi:hypothetical protein